MGDRAAGAVASTSLTCSRIYVAISPAGKEKSRLCVRSGDMGASGLRGVGCGR